MVVQCEQVKKKGSNWRPIMRALSRRSVMAVAWGPVKVYQSVWLVESPTRSAVAKG